MKNKISIILAIIICLSAVLFVPTYAITENSDLSTLTVELSPDGNPAADVYFNIYSVAEPDKAGVLRLCSDFEKLGIDIDLSDENDWSECAETVKAYALKNKITPSFSQKTDKFGTVKFANLKDGLYLVVGIKSEKEDSTLFVSPFLVLAPKPEKDGCFSYDISASPKSVRVSHTDDKITRKVTVVWQDTVSGSSRPEKLEVDLLKDGQVFDTVALSENNNWTYTWKELAPDCEWTVVENVPDGYKTKIEEHDGIFEIINTFRNEKTEPSSENESTSEKTENELPNTGQLWWPAPLLTASGLFLIIVGLLCRRSENYE